MINGKLIICFTSLREVLKNNFNSILVKNFNNMDKWISVINNVSNNFYDQIRYNALIFAKKENRRRVKKFLMKNKIRKNLIQS